MPDNYHTEDIYQGGYSSLNPDSFTTGYRLGGGYMGGKKEGSLGMATDPRTANILNEVSTKLQTGAKQIEVSTIQPGTFESIPTQQLKEVKRLSELTGIDISVHAPLIEPSGISRQGGYSELSREEAERQMLFAVLRSHEMSPKGNMPVTFHSAQEVPGPEYHWLKENGKRVEEKARIPIINQESGQIGMVQAEKRFLLGKLSNDERDTAEDQIEIRNRSEWVDNLANLVAIKERADRMIAETEFNAQETMKKLKTGSSFESLGPTEKSVIYRYQNAGLELNEIQKHLASLFEKAYKYGEGGEFRDGKNSYEMSQEEHKKALAGISENFGKSLNEAGDLSGQSRVMDQLMSQLRGLPSPKLFKPVEDFALSKSAESFGNVAFGAYKKFGSDAPIISIENPPVGQFGLSRAEDLKKLVEAARDKFVENARKEGISEREARNNANKLIGVTWDVGHINMLRKYGYTEEDVIKEAEKIAPVVKHIHLSDNFGFEHTELPMGMGNVPIKEIMEKLGQKGFEARKVIEAGNWWEHFKTAPFQQTLEAFGSPIYGIKMQPYWNQSIGVQGYFSGYGQMLPQGNYDTFGSGFSMLPAELGGQRQSTGRSRMSGSPME